MGVRSRYKDQIAAEKPAKEIPAEEAAPAPSEKFKLDDEPTPDAVVVHHEADAPPSAALHEATARLQQQVEQLERSEELQREAVMQQHQAMMQQHQAMMQQRPMTHNEKLAAWRAGGMSEGNWQFLAENPQMVEHDYLTGIAANQAAQEGHQRDTDAHRNRTRELFDQHLKRLHAQAPTPEFFQPPPPPSEPDRTGIYSAPVSREVANGSGRRELSLSQVRLSPQQREAAALAGVSEVEYARQMQKLPEWKRQREESKPNDRNHDRQGFSHCSPCRASLDSDP